jgi:hypothetical protein
VASVSNKVASGELSRGERTIIQNAKCNVSPTVSVTVARLFLGHLKETRPLLCKEISLQSTFTVKGNRQFAVILSYLFVLLLKTNIKLIYSPNFAGGEQLLGSLFSCIGRKYFTIWQQWPQQCH